MEHSVRYAVLFFVAIALPAAAQTATAPGNVTRNGVVSLGIGTVGSTAPGTGYANPAAATQPTSGATGGASGGGSTTGAASTGGAAVTRSRGAGGAGAAAQAGSGGSSGSAAPAPSGSAPAWLLCPPSGALGMPPFVTGTNLSCAP